MAHGIVRKTENQVHKRWIHLSWRGEGAGTVSCEHPGWDECSLTISRVKVHSERKQEGPVRVPQNHRHRAHMLGELARRAGVACRASSGAISVQNRDAVWKSSGKGPYRRPQQC